MSERRPLQTASVIIACAALLFVSLGLAALLEEATGITLWLWFAPPAAGTLWAAAHSMRQATKR